MLREEDGEPAPSRTTKKVKFPTPPAREKVNAYIPNYAESLGKVDTKVVETKERKDKAMPGAIAPQDKAEMQRPFWCHDCGFLIPSCTHRTISYEQLLKRWVG